jgi:hypothetical protein
MPYIFRACIATGYISKACRQVKVTFIPKPRKANYTKGKAHNPINLSPSMLKMIQKLANQGRDIEVLSLTSKPLCLSGKSNETALQNLITYIQNAVEHTEIALGAFLKAPEQHGIGHTICQCISSMLGSRKI